MLKKPAKPLVIAVLFVAAIIAVVVGQRIVLAISASGPDSGEFGGQNASYVLSDTCDVRGATVLTVPLYFTQNPGTVTIHINVTSRESGTMRVDRAGGSGTNWSGNISGDTDININGFTYVSPPGRWVATFRAELTSNGPNCGSGVYGTSINFRIGLKANSQGVPQGLIGYSHLNTSKFATANQYRCDSSGDPGCGKYYNYAIKAAPSCGQTSGVANIEIFDGDDPSGATQYNIQPQSFTVVVYDITSGANVVARFAPPGVGLDPPTWSHGSGGWGQSGTVDLSFNFLQGHKYQFNINHVYANNVLQFQLPFDTIYSIINCGSIPYTGYDLTPSVTVDPNEAQAGSKVNFTYSVKNDGVFQSPKTRSGVANTTWTVTQVKTRPDGSVDPSGALNSSGKTSYPAQATTKIPAVSTLTVPVTDPPGTTYCRTLTVAPAKGYTKHYRVTEVRTAHYDKDGKFTGWTYSSNGPTGAFVDYDSNSTSPYYSTGWSSWSANQRYYDYYQPTVVTASLKSQPACVTIIDWPMVYFSGADVWAGGMFNPGTGCTTAAAQQIYTSSNGVAGRYQVSSNSQMAAFATGTIKGFGSASQPWYGSFHGKGSTPYEDALFFANKTVSGSPLNPSGQLGTAANRCITDYYSTSGAGLPSTNLSNVPSGNYYVGGNGILTLTASGPINKRITLTTSKDVVIASNITYSSAGVATIGDLPRLVIASKGSVTVNRAVSRIDGIYEAKGQFNTCDVKPVSGLVPVCNVQLTINGAVLANRVGLRRTGGTVGSPNRLLQAAEYFNYTPDALLGTYADNQGTPSLQVVEENELPPRY